MFFRFKHRPQAAPRVIVPRDTRPPEQPEVVHSKRPVHVLPPASGAVALPHALVPQRAPPAGDQWTGWRSTTCHSRSSLGSVKTCIFPSMASWWLWVAVGVATVKTVGLTLGLG